MITIESKIYFDLTPPPGAELVLNPDFEDLDGADDFADWDELDGGSGTVEDEALLVHGGVHAVKVTSGADWAYVRQQINVERSTPYTLTFWTRGDGTHCGQYYILSETGFVSIFLPTNITGTTYKQITKTFTTGPLDDWVKIMLQDPLTGGVAYYDDASLLEVESTIWIHNEDVLQEPAPTWEYGIIGHGPTDLLASTGIANFYLDNSAANSEGLDGLYSPDHDDALEGFGEGMAVKITIKKGIGAEVEKFVGTVAAIRPTSGLFDGPVVEVQVHDWIGFLSTQELGIFQVDDSKRADQALTTVLVNFPIQPEATDFDTGVETFLLVFNTDNPKSSMASFFQKMCRNEMGRVYCKGDGTLVFENRNARAQITDSAFTLDGTMTEFEISYERADIFNYIETKITIAEVDAAATTQLWDLHEQGCPEIKPGQTMTLICGYSDPTTGKPISAVDVVNPITIIEFGSVPDYASNDLIAFLDQYNDPGGNAMIVRLTNTGSVTGYLNDLTIKGKGIYVDDPLTLLNVDQDSIDERGERRFILRLEHIVDPNVAQSYASTIRGAYSNPHFRASRIEFLANQTDALATGAIAAEPSTRFISIEEVTGVSYSFYVNRIRYTQKGPNLWVRIAAQPAALHGTFVWDASHWDDVEDARWSA